MKIKTSEEITQELKKLPSWKQEGVFLVRELAFKDFVQAFSFMSRIALLAEKMDHHPNWENVYNQLKIRLSTHDAGSVTEKDFQLASQIEEALHDFDTI